MPRPIVLKQQEQQKKQQGSQIAKDVINKIDYAQVLIKKAQSGDVGSSKKLSEVVGDIQSGFGGLQNEFKKKQEEKLYDKTKKWSTNAQQLKNKAELKVIEKKRDFSKKLDLPKVINEPRLSRSDSPTVSEAYSSRSGSTTPTASEASSSRSGSITPPASEASSSRSGSPIAHEMTEHSERRPAFQKDLSQVNDWVMNNTGPYHPIPAPRTKFPQISLRANTPEHLYEDVPLVRPIPKKRTKLPDKDIPPAKPPRLQRRLDDRFRELQGFEGDMGELRDMSREMQKNVSDDSSLVNAIYGNIKNASNNVVEGNRNLKGANEVSIFRPLTPPEPAVHHEEVPLIRPIPKPRTKLSEEVLLDPSSGSERLPSAFRLVSRQSTPTNPTEIDALFNERFRNFRGMEDDIRDLSRSINVGNRNLSNKKTYRRKLAALGALGIGGVGGAAALGIGLGVGLNKNENTKNNVINKQSEVVHKDSNEDDEDSNDGYIVDDISNQTNKYARGGRIDGIAVKGKTKGRIL